MKKVLLTLITASLVLLAAGCASGPPDMGAFPEDMGVIMPVLMFGDKAEGDHDSATYQFAAPKPIAADSQGNIYVGGKEFVLSKYTSDGEFVAVIAERGEGPGKVDYCKGLAVDSMDNVYATDANAKKIVVFDKDGNLVREFGEAGTGPGQFDDIGPIAIDGDNNLYVSDDSYGVLVFDKDDNYVKTIGIKGEGEGETSEFGWVAVDSDLRQLYVAVDGMGKIDVFNIDTGDFLFDMGGLGQGPGQWEEDIEGLAVGPWGLVFAMDEAGGNIKVFTGEGQFVTQFGKAGLYEGELASSESIAYDPANRCIVVADEKNYRVQVFSLASLGL